MEENNKSAFDNWKKLSSADSLFCRTFAPSKKQLVRMDKTEQQKEATKFSFEYLRYFLQQEEIVERLINNKVNQLRPEIERLIDKKIEKRMKCRK